MADQPTTHPARKRLLVGALLVFMLLGVAWGIYYLIFGANIESTDDAYTHGNLVQITPQVSGTVVAIEADDTDAVQAGQPVIRLDPIDAEVALQHARAQLAQAVRQTRTRYVQNDALQADVEMRQAEVTRAQADLARSRADYARRQALAKSGGVSGEELLHAQTAMKAAQSALAQAQAAEAAARAKARTNHALTDGTTVQTHPDVLQAAAALRSAWLAQSRNVLPAPVSGMVAKRSVQLGQRVAPGTPLMTVVPLDQIWIEANFKENQLRHMRVGQSVVAHADLYGKDVAYHGRIVGIDAGTGGAFALLPAQNATGNWIKVVQRVPVRIALDPQDLRRHPLRVGLSMNVDVTLGDEHADAGTNPAPAASGDATRTGVLSTPAFDIERREVDDMIQSIIKDNLDA